MEDGRLARYAPSATLWQIMIETETKTEAPKAPAKGVQVTDKALAKIRTAIVKEGISPEQGGLRLGVQGGGCSGLEL